MAFTPDGRWLIGGYYDGHVIIWDLSRKQILTRFRAHEEVRYLAISPDGTRLATSCCRELKLWYLDKFRESFEQR